MSKDQLTLEQINNLTKEQIKFLRFLKRSKYTPKTLNQVYKKFHIDYNGYYKLFNNVPVVHHFYFHEDTDYDESLLEINDTGIKYLESLADKRKYFLVPNTIASLALVTAIISILMQVLG